MVRCVTIPRSSAEKTQSHGGLWRLPRHFVFELAERHNRIPGLKQRIIGRDNNESQYFDCTKDYPLLRNGSIDATVQFGARGRDFRSRRSVNIKAAVNYLLQDLVASSPGV